MDAFIDFVFDDTEGPEGPRLVEVENPKGRSVRVGEWLTRGDGYRVLRVPSRITPITDEMVERAASELYGNPHIRLTYGGEHEVPWERIVELWGPDEAAGRAERDRLLRQARRVLLAAVMPLPEQLQRPEVSPWP